MRMLRVLSLGAGVQSTCVLLMSGDGTLPRLDAAVFADTQWEPIAVYKHLAWLEVEAKGRGIPVYRVTRGDLRADGIEFRANGGKGSHSHNTAPPGTVLTHEQGNGRFASIPLFVKNPDGSVGIIKRQCTSEYKIEPVERFIRRALLGLKPRQVAPAGAVEHWFGISADEASRRRVSPNHWQVFRYPLIDDVTSPRRDTFFDRGFHRQDCLDWLRERGYPEPPRSACLGCPFHTDAEWVRLRDTDPEGWADAVAFDKAIRAADAALIADGAKLAGRLVGLPYLHRSCVPLDEVAFNPTDRQAVLTYGMGNECAGVCGV
jgi:hypothetical protein